MKRRRLGGKKEKGLYHPVKAVDQERGNALDKRKKHPEQRVVTASTLCLGSRQAGLRRRMSH